MRFGDFARVLRQAKTFADALGNFKDGVSRNRLAILGNVVLVIRAARGQDEIERAPVQRLSIYHQTVEVKDDCGIGMHCASVLEMKKNVKRVRPFDVCESALLNLILISGL